MALRHIVLLSAVVTAASSSTGFLVPAASSSIGFSLPAASSSTGFFKHRAALRGAPVVSLDASVTGKWSIGTTVAANDLVVAADVPATALSNYTRPAELEVHTMLLWAARVATVTGHADMGVTEMCVPLALQSEWRAAFGSAVELMLHKTLHDMQQGLVQIAHSALFLIDGSSCGFLTQPGLNRLAEQAKRLRVLASAGSVDHLDATVKYEPLKALTVGGVDIHLELNALIVAWKLNKNPEEMGSALAAFLRDFVDDSSNPDYASNSGYVDNDDASGADSVAGVADADVHETRTPRFWSKVLQTALLRLGGGHDWMSEACLSAAATRRYGDALEDAIARMLEKTRQGMRSGIKEVASATIVFVDSLEAPCSDADGVMHLRNAAYRLNVFASARTLVDFSKHIEYEPMKVLTVGGIDVHKELNRFLIAWVHRKGAAELADGLVDFFEDFKEHEVVDQAPTPKASDEL